MFCVSFKVDSSKKKFEEIQKANQAMVRKIVEDNYSSSDEDDDDGDEDAEGKQNKILDLTFTTYTNQTGNSISSSQFGKVVTPLCKWYVSSGTWPTQML